MAGPRVHIGLIWVGVGLYVAFSWLSVVRGSVNPDEGWYAYAARLVFLGQFPYQDFAFTQMPLLPYVYGAPQRLLGSGVDIGRFTSLAIALITVVVTVQTARRLGGERAAGVTALLLATFTYGIYFTILVKTYALTSLLFAATLLILSTRDRQPPWTALAVACALAAAQVRLSAIFFALPVIGYALARSPWRHAAGGPLALAICLAFGLTTIWWMVPDVLAAKWHILDRHLEPWASLPLLSKVKIATFTTVPKLAQAFPLHLLLALVLAYCATRRRDLRDYLCDRPAIPVVAAGLALFVTAHIASGGWQPEYFVPAVVTSLPLLAVGYSRLYEYTDPVSRLLLRAGLASVLIAGPLTAGIQHFQAVRRTPPLEELREMAHLVTQHTAPSDRILALEALPVVVGTDRFVLPSLEMGPFSYTTVDSATAKKLRLTNYERLSNYLDDGTARIALLTEGDFVLFDRFDRWQQASPRQLKSPATLRDRLMARYELAAMRPEFGINGTSIFLFVRRD